MSVLEALGQAAPFYNLGMVVIVTVLFIKLFRTGRGHKQVYLAPWGFVFAGLCIYIVEEVITILRAAGVVNIPMHINGFFELAIIILFIYGVLLQKELKKGNTYCRISCPTCNVPLYQCLYCNFSSKQAKYHDKRSIKGHIESHHKNFLKDHVDQPITAFIQKSQPKIVMKLI